ncbi:glycerophosphoryl diester phosphodiesterase [Roseibium hamelinense]|uniref:Glycerophosphoryl diester phosphodiesterase n=1 Tax=Roseibium hamelinense TaxID=150831 RepID=A0A562SH04_9HYPH|nr:glycerophosphodiester phosphodiesterase family protein [Roseibium hamelinense]MTI44206.1 glycerophosphodiester phosphodiesterase [Roseibium hamelinense]TWI80010.1 glycerophosphoryl diester phosphodiesterase [Roseibium hamelinense]
MSDLDAIMARPIAHRGYHDADNGIIENTPSAISAAVEHGFGIEVDVQETADGEALVFHDYTLDRLADGTGKVIDTPAAALTRMNMRTGTDSLWLLSDLFDLVDGRVPLVIEIKSLMTRGAQQDFVKHVVDQVAAYRGPACIKSFDADMLSIARGHNPAVLRGVVADGAHNKADYRRFTRMDRFILRNMLHTPRTRPHFISYGINDLPALGPSFWRKAFGIPIMTWTVRTADQRDRATRYADQIVFEGFDPDKA